MLILQVIEMYTVVMMSFIVPMINALWVTNDVMERTTVVTTQTKKTVVCFILCAFIYFRWYQIFVDKQIVRCSLTF
jgi:hypothetical protein